MSIPISSQWRVCIERRLEVFAFSTNFFLSIILLAKRKGHSNLENTPSFLYCLPRNLSATSDCQVCWRGNSPGVSERFVRGSSILIWNATTIHMVTNVRGSATAKYLARVMLRAASLGLISTTFIPKTVW